jgi:hypothetical protein
MIDLDTFKQTLVKNGIVDLSDEQIVKLRDQQDQMAEILFGMWIEKVNIAQKEV